MALILKFLISILTLLFQLKDFDRRLVITDLEICATCLHYWSDRRDQMNNIFMWGDVRGNISAIVLSDAFLFNPVLYGFKLKIPFADILRGRIPGAKGEDKGPFTPNDPVTVDGRRL